MPMIPIASILTRFVIDLGKGGPLIVVEAWIWGWSGFGACFFRLVGWLNFILGGSQKAGWSGLAVLFA